MIISEYSVIASVVFYNVCLAAVVILSRKNRFAAKQTVSLLLFFTLLGMIRLFIPVSMEKAYVIRSYSVVPAIEDFLRRPLADGITPGRILLSVWGLGAMIVLVRFACKELRFRREATNYQITECEDICAVAKGLGLDCAICVSPDVSSPFTSNIFHPVIYLPDIELSEDEWKTVLSHEAVHIRSHDNLKKLFFLAVEALFWWNPLAHLSSGEITELLELRCDEKTTRGMTGLERAEYGETLLKVASLTQQSKIPAIASAAVTAGEHLRRRIKVLVLENSKHISFFQKLIPILLVALFVMSYFVIVQPCGYASEGLISEDATAEDSWRSIGYLEENNTYLLHQNGEYTLYIDGARVYTIPEDNLQIEPFKSLPVIEGES